MSGLRATVIVSVCCALLAAALAFKSSRELGAIHAQAKQPHQHKQQQPTELASATKPNVLLILLDDAGYSDVKGFGRDDAPTPTLEQLAQEGVRFTRHYADSTCKPARMSLLAGRAASELITQPDFRGIPAEVLTLPEALQQAGYATRHIGKWHLGDTHVSTRPEFHGFDDWLGFLTQFRLQGPDANGNTNRRPSYVNPWLEGKDLPYQGFEGHLETILADRVIQTLHELPADQPWFINYWPFAPHNPVTASSEWLAKFPDTPAGRYDALLAQIDFEIGRVFDAVNARGDWNNTLVIVASDNGGTNQFKDNNYPFHGTKGHFFEGSLRTPLIVRWPDQRYAGQTNDEIVAIQDIYPTVLAAAGLTQDERAAFDLARVAAQQPRPPRLLIHEILSIGMFNYSVLNSDGTMRLTYDGLADINNRPLDKPEISEQLRAHYYRFREHKVELDVTLEQTATGWRATGLDTLRTPGFGALSVQLPLQKPALPLTKDAILAEQAGIWQLILTQDQRLHLTFGSDSWQTEPLAIEQWPACQMITAGFWQTQSRLGQQSNLDHISLDIGAARVIEQIQQRLRDDNADISQPTAIYATEQLPIGPPRFLNTILNAQPKAVLHRLSDRASCTAD